ncbi:MAG: Lipase [Burkholderiaceae bacterium]|nr:Lipase [Burkholderiaceae bacterium]
MGMFDYRNYTSSESAELLATAYRLATYTNTAGFLGLPVEQVLPWVADIALNTGFYPNTAQVGIPVGWRELNPNELGLPDSAVDFSGHYTITSPLTGILPTGLQAKVFGEYDAQGHLTRVSVSFTGTNSIADLPDYFQLNTGEMVPYLEPLLTAVKNFVTEQNLTAEDVIITGYSLGGAMTNLAAQNRRTLVDGFFENANFVGVEAPLIYDDPSILNFGYENDVVYRVIGDETSVLGAIQAADPGLVNPDSMYGSTVDNIVLFDDMYASPLWPMPLFSLVNIPAGWYAHVDGVFTDAYQRIIDNPFYDYMERDSTTIVANLTSVTRGTTWVQDKATVTSDHYSTPAFLIGSKFDDLLQGGQSSDYIYGDSGNDSIRTGAGADRVDGGTGTDTLRLDGKASDWNAYRLSDGTVFFDAKNGSDLKQAEHIEKLAFESDALSILNPYEIGAQNIIDKRFWLFGSNIAYQADTEGTNGNDTLSAKAVFAKDGDDTLTAVGTGSLLHAGEGNDILKGGLGNDQMYGAEGNDRLLASKGNDSLFGGVGDDIFMFNILQGKSVIMDFNLEIGDNDSLVISKNIFADTNALSAATHQVGTDVVINQGIYSIALHDTLVNDVLHHTFLV